MTLYEVVLFLHLLGVVTLFIAVGLIQRGGAQVRTAETLDHLRLWLGLVRMTRNMFPTSALLLLVTGLYMTSDVWTFDAPWIVVSIVGLIALTVVGGAVIGPRFRRVGMAAGGAGDGPVPPEIRRSIEEPTIWIALYANSGAAMGILWLMVTKPDWAASIAVVVGLALLGGFLGRVSLRTIGTTS
jgi:Predicted integral membrane protein (DUF2269)